MIRVKEYTGTGRCTACGLTRKVVSSVQIGETQFTICPVCLNSLDAGILDYFKKINEQASSSDAVAPMKAFGTKTKQEDSPKVKEWLLVGMVNGIAYAVETTGSAEFKFRTEGGGFTEDEIIDAIKKRGYNNITVGRDMDRTIYVRRNHSADHQPTRVGK